MKKVAIFGNAGGGKSTLAKRLSELTGLPLYVLDVVQDPSGRRKISSEEYQAIHAEILAKEEWIIDGFGCMTTLWERLSVADTLVYVDLPLSTHYLRVTKRLLGGLFRTPEGWPENCPVWKSSLQSYRIIPLCHRRLTLRYREFVREAYSAKEVHHLTSSRQIQRFLELVAKGGRADAKGLES